MSIRTTLLAISFLSAVLHPVSASAATPITVTTTDEVSATECTLPDAMFAANFDLDWGQCPAGSGADVITITAAGTITLTDALTNLNTPLDIHGPGADQLTIRRSDAAGAFRIIFVTADGSGTLSGLSLENGLVDGIGSGGAGVINFGTLVLEDVVVTDNHVLVASDSVNPAPTGGGIVNHGTMTIRRSTVSANSVAAGQTATGGATIAMARGGGLFNLETMTIERSAIIDNDTHAEVASSDPGANAWAEGGGVLNHGTLTIATSTISNNAGSVGPSSPTWTIVGGGISNQGTLDLAGSTIAFNTAAQGSNLAADATETIAGTIIASDPGGPANCRGSVETDGGSNLDFPAGCAGLEAAIHLDPGLGPLADNGGPTKTHAIGAGSPALDGATSIDGGGDQRGMPRPYDQPGVPNAGDGADIGAFELQDVTAPQTTITKGPKKRIETRKKRVRVLFRFVSDEAGSIFACKLDGQAWKTCTSPATYRVKKGRHVFRVAATDQAANSDPSPALRRFRVVRV